MSKLFKRVVGAVLGGIIFIVAGLVIYSLYLSRPLFDETLEEASLVSVTLAPPARALTFARYESDSGVQLMLVTGLQSGIAEGINLTAIFDVRDPIQLYQQQGYARLAGIAQIDAVQAKVELLQDEVAPVLGDDESTDATALSAALPDAPAVDTRVRIALERLVLPANFSYPHLAAGTNYKAHAEEVYVDDPPFLFPKLSQATTWQASIDGSRTRHLDYEAEICFVPLEDIEEPGQMSPLGLVLCNDVTDRWATLSEMALSAPMGTTGFATGKGGESFLPVGYLLVIPRTPDFYADLEFRLYRNGELRQKASTRELILSPVAMIAQAFRDNAQTYFKGDETVPLLIDNRIPAGTLLLSGTPGGVIFKPLNIWNSGLYLAPGERIITVAPYLGHLDNTVE